MKKIINDLEKNKKIDILLVQPDQGEFVRKRIFYPGVEIPLNIACLSASCFHWSGGPGRGLAIRVT